jgi:mannitol-specific phosphotransferase system IIBC component
LHDEFLWISLSLSLDHSDLLAAELDRKTADYILHMIREEEAKNEQLKKQAAAAAAQHVAVVEDAGPGEAATEQSFNREQVQEQEQVSFESPQEQYLYLRYSFYCFLFI